MDNSAPSHSESVSTRTIFHRTVPASILIVLLLLVAGGLSLLVSYSVALNQMVKEHNSLLTPPQSTETHNRVLTGTIFEWNETGSFLRLAVQNGAIYSIYLRPETIITEGGGAVVGVPTVDPFMTVTVEVVSRPEPEGEGEFDFDATAVRIPGLADLSIEERAGRLFNQDYMMNQ